jgi:2-polyprenyl-6-methoxyphenol hydroxylase-like FAD-dependent oxidoreductase
MEVAIIGGGPVGLVFAHLLLEKYGDKVNLTVFEKRSAYSRRQILLLTPASLPLLPECATRKLFDGTGPGCGTLPPNRDRQRRCYRFLKGTDGSVLPASVRTKELEEALRCGIKGREVNDAIIGIQENDELVGSSGRTYGPFGLIIGADGASSAIRQALGLRFTTNTKVVPVTSRYGAIFNFEGVPVKEGVFNRVTPHARKIMSQQDIQHKWRFFRGKGVYYIGLNVSEDEAAQITAGGLSKDLRAKLEKVCRQVTPVKKGCAFSKLVHQAAFEVDPQVSTAASGKTTQFGKGRVFLIGDAAMTTDFFSGSGVNNGFLMAKELVDLMGEKAPKPPSQAKFKAAMDTIVQQTADVVNNVWHQPGAHRRTQSALKRRLK